jgi:hypothetical protein
MDDIYFALKNGEELATDLYAKVEEFYAEIENNGRASLWRKVYRAYYALNEFDTHQASEIKHSGEQGEFSKLKANHFRNLITHLLIFVTQQRPSFQCRATNTDYKSQIQTILGSNIIDYYIREKKFGPMYRQMVELALMYAESYMMLDWDFESGDVLDVDMEMGEVIRSGDAYAKIYEPHRVIRDCSIDATRRQDWYILSDKMNRYELAARYPQFKERIMQFGNRDPQRVPVQGTARGFESDNADTLTIYHFIHDKTPACPDGREAIFLDSGLLLGESPLTKPIFPVFRMMPSPQYGSPFGYTVAFDLLVVQEAIDLMYSTILSNQSTFGVQNVWIKPGTNLNPIQLGSGLNLLESDEKPEAINLTNTPPEIFNFLKGLESLGEMLSGVNSVARGQPEASLKSGAALALVASQAVQFSNGTQDAFSTLLEDSATGLLQLLTERVQEPRIVAITGEHNRSYVKSFIGNDLKGIKRAVVDLGNPVSRTMAGRLQLAENLLQSGLMKRPEQYLEVVSTGRLEPLVEDQESEHLLIRAENEAMRNGEQVAVIAVDEHLQHIKSHRAILADPDARREPQLVQLVLGHIQQHIEALRTTDPALLNSLGQAPMGARPPESGANGQPAPQGGPPPQNPNQVQAPQGTPPDVAAQMPSMPKPPPGTPPDLQ